MPRLARLRRAGGLLGEGVLETLWPTRCVGCERPGTLLCDECRVLLPRIDQALACPRCGAPFGRLVCTECNPCLDQGDEGAAPAPGSQTPSDTLADILSCVVGVRSFGTLEWPLDRMVRAYKDAGERALAPELGRMLAQAAREGFPDELPGVDALVFVPCTPQAFSRRGFDHMELVACACADELGIPLDDVLARRTVRDQRDLSRAGRVANAAGSFAVLHDLGGRTVLLVDDVFTTGSTVAGAARALLSRGAARVLVATVARAW